MALNLKSAIRKLKAEQVKLAKSRDVLRELISEMSEVENDAADALDSIEYAIDALSKLQ